MNNNAAMQASFEIQKNIKASIYTVAICIAIALILFFLAMDFTTNSATRFK